MNKKVDVNETKHIKSLYQNPKTTINNKDFYKYAFKKKALYLNIEERTMKIIY